MTLCPACKKRELNSEIIKDNTIFSDCDCGFSLITEV